MTTCAAAFIFAFFVAVLMTHAVRHSALSMGLVDRPDAYRKFHKTPVPRLGGIAIWVGFFLPVAYLFLFHRNPVSALLLTRPVQMGGLLGGATLVAVMGAVDDIRSLRPAWKLVFQCIAGVAAWSTGLSIHAVNNPFGPTLHLGWFSLPVTVFWFVGCMNAVNLMDGLDGLAAGVCLFVSATLFLVALLYHNVLAMLLMACLSGATLGFLLFNFYPAKIFLGDSGSMLLGFLVAALSLIGSTRKAETAIALLIPIVALGLPIFDTSLAILRRWYRRFPISSPDRQHIHHVLVSMGYSQRRAVLLLYSATIVLGGAALLITVGRSEVTMLVLGSLAIIAFVSVRVLGGLRLEDVFLRFSEDQARKRAHQDARVAIEQAIQQMRTAGSVEEIWRAAGTAFDELGLEAVELRTGGRLGGPLAWQSTERGPANPTGQRWTAELSLSHNGRDLGRMNVARLLTVSTPLAEFMDLVDLIRHEIAGSIHRLAGDGDSNGAGA